MDFELPSEVQSLVKIAREFREERLAPLEEEFLREGNVEWALRPKLQEEARERGLWAIEVPDRARRHGPRPARGLRGARGAEPPPDDVRGRRLPGAGPLQRLPRAVGPLRARGDRRRAPQRLRLHRAGHRVGPGRGRDDRGPRRRRLRDQRPQDVHRPRRAGRVPDPLRLDRPLEGLARRHRLPDRVRHPRLQHRPPAADDGRRLGPDRTRIRQLPRARPPSASAKRAKRSPSPTSSSSTAG